MADPTTPIPANSGGTGVSPVGAIADAAGKLFDLVGKVLQPGILATQAYFQQLLNAAPQLQDPFADVNANRRRMNQILVYGALGIIALLIIAVIVKNRKQ